MNVRLFLAAAAVALPAASALPAPYTSHFAALRAVVEARSDDAGLTSRQRNALDGVVRSLDRDSKSLRADLKLAASVAKSLDGAFPGDAELGAAVGSVVTSLQTEVVAE